MFRIADDVDLPANAATQTFAFLARRGAGKTYSAGVVVEALLGGHVQVVVIDPVGTWWGLRLAADGVSPGIDIPVFGGLRGDIPLEPTAGAVVARLCAEQRTSLVLDVSMFSGAEQRRFVTDFARELFQLKKENRGPIHVVFEEAQEFFPQVVQSDSAAMVGAVLKLWKIGRNFGIGGTLISQRPQEVNKSALNLTECLVTGQLTGPHERKTIAGWVTDQGMDRKALDELPSLPVGTVYLWSPQWLRTMVKTRFIAKRTFDASATPESDAPSGEGAALRPIDLARVQKAMALTVEHVKANDPKALRAEIAELRKKLEATPRIDDVRLQQALAHERDLAVARYISAERTFAELSQQHGRMWRAIKAALDAAQTAPALPDEFQRLNTALPEFPGQARISPYDLTSSPSVIIPVFKTGGRQGLHPPARAPRDGSVRMLIALAEMHPTPLSYRQLGTLAVMKVEHSGTFSNYMSRLSTGGLITRDGGLVRLTEAGLKAAGKVQKPATARELLDMWREKLPGKAADMLEWLAAERVPKTHQELAHHTGLAWKKSGTFSNYVSKLTTNGLAVRVPGKGLRAVEELWLR